jgi:hypothetical protein
LYASQFNETIQQLFDSPQGILGIMSFFEEEGSGSTADQNLWAALDWTFIDQYQLSTADKKWFFGPNNIPADLEATITQGSQVFKNGQLKTGFATQLLNILTGDPSSSQCDGLANAFDVAEGTVLASTPGPPISGLDYIVNPVPGALQFGSNGAVPYHAGYVIQTQVATMKDGTDVWTFYSDVYKPPPPIRHPPRGPHRPHGSG